MNALDESPPLVSAPAKRAKLAERLRAASQREVQCPLSFAQQRLWFLDQLEPDSALYNVPAVVRLTGELDAAALEHALRGIIVRHEALRTRFECAGETPQQVVSRQFEFSLRLVDAAGEEEAQKWIRAEVRRPFDLKGAESLLRASIVRLSVGEHLLVLTLHHIASDEWSLHILFHELEELYRAHIEGRASNLPRLPVQYSDYAVWQAQHLTDRFLQEQLQYWKGQLGGAPAMTELMTDRPRARVPSLAGRTLTRFLGVDLAPRLQQLAAGQEATLFMVLLAAFKAVVHRYTGLEDIIVGTPVAGRNKLETEGLIGFFVNTLLLRSHLAGNPTFATLLERVRAVALGAYAHQELPFEKVVEALRPERSLNHLMFTRIMFALQTRPSSDNLVTLPGLKAEPLEVDTGTAKFDLTFVAQDSPRGLGLRVEYNSDLFDEATISRLCGHFEILLRAVLANPALRLSDLPMLGEAERHQLLVEWNHNTTEYPRQKCLQQLFEEQAAARPDAVALVFAGESMTYGELNSRANRLAHRLRRVNFKAGSPVAVCLERSANMVVSLLAILKAGGAYVPLDPRNPMERLSFMLADSRASVLLTQKGALPRLPRRAVETICLDTDVDWIESEKRENPPVRVTPEDVAYIIYTSGSTGQPKGVAVPHRAIVRLVRNTNYIELDATDRIAQVSNVSFDAATFEIWGALLNGAQLRGITAEVALSPRDFARELRDQGITAMFLTSALFNQLAAEVPGAFATMRTLLAGGEALDPKWVRAVLQDRPPLRLVNGYGPTENTTFTCCALLQGVPEGAASVPIGRPISNTQVYILDAQLNPVPIGVPGELLTGGDGLALGYWNRPELTGEKFTLHQFSQGGPCQRLYRTGDLARFLPDGSIEFLGRLDNQVKVRGFRIELGEIETVLGRHAGVRECVVKIWGAGAGQTRLAAYFVAAGKHGPKPSLLRAFLADQLPDYMVPSAFVRLEALPLTSNGKVDRRALPEPDRARPATEKKYASPRDEIELELTRIWEEILEIEPIGIEDHFFELGGHSLLAVRVVARMEKAFGCKLRLATLFTASTIEKLAVVLREQMREGRVTAGTSIVELQTKGQKPPLFLVHGAGGGMFWGYVNLARRLGPGQPVFGFSSQSVEGGAEMDTVEAMAAQYVKDLQLVQPRGPYFLGGYCFGGNVAYEMARQLESKGEKVALLALMNCAPANSSYMRARWTPAWCLRFARNLLYWADYCRQWTVPQRREFLRWKWGRLRRWISVHLGKDLPDQKLDEADELIDVASVPESERDLWRRHIRALLRFQPQPISGRVHLFRSPGHPLWCSFAPDYGWGELARQGVDMTVVSGAHEKILEEPWVDETAAAIKKALAQNREVDLAFWQRELAGAPTRIELPSDHPRLASRTPKTGLETRLLPKTRATRGHGPDRDLLVLAALNIVLFRYSGQEDLVIGVQTGGNGEPENVLPLRLNLAGNPSLRELMERVRAATIAAQQHAEWPFQELVAALRPNAEPDCHPLVQIFFTRGSRPAPAGFDLRVCLIEGEVGCTLRLEYAEDLFERGTIQRMLGHLEMALQGIVAEPEQPLSGLSILTRAERDLLLVKWNQTDRDFPRDKTLIQLFQEQVERSPTATALVCRATRLTYRELSERAALMARQLRNLGVGNQALVGICLERSEDMVAGILGTLQAGGAYVPLDPSYPKARLSFIAQSAKLRVLLTRRKLKDLLPALDATVLCVEDMVETPVPPPPSQAAGPKDLAYVLYTSGSTGQPKGVAVEHRNAVALVTWARDVFSQEEISGVLASTSICFDLSIFELFVPLCWGGKVILADNALALPGLPAAHEVTLINTVPSAMRELLRINGVPRSVRVVNLAGEPLPTALVDQIHQNTAVQKVYDLYGPTETTTYSTFVLRLPGQPPTIGRPLANEQVYILDKQMQPAPIGIPGDLYIGGAGLARGYLHRPDLTAERFVAHPFQGGARVYKTGDLARWREDGQVVFLGRSDHQVKIRGFRIELGEIETILKAHSGVTDAVVIAREDRPGEKRLAAYVVAGPENQLTADGLRSAVREKLPEYMMPASIVFLAALPMTPNGKIDRRALPTPPDEARNTSGGLVAPRTEFEAKVASVWGEVLGLKTVGVTDNFFEFGGHSLLAIQVISRLRELFHLELPLSCLFEAPTVEALAAGVDSGRWKTNEDLIPPLAVAPRDQVLPASFMQEQLWFLNHLEPGSDAYNVPVAIRCAGPLDLTVLQQALDLIVSRHEALRTTLHFFDGNLSQVVAPSLSVKFSVRDLAEANESRILEILQAEARQTFDLERGPLLRASVVRMNARDHAIMLVMHHAVTDGWSLEILFRELEANYRALAAGAPAPALAVLPAQYADYAVWQRVWMQGAVQERELIYWRKKLEGAPMVVELPVDLVGPAPAAAKAARHTVVLPQPLGDAMLVLGQAEGATKFMILMAALAVTLQKWTGQSDLVIGTVVAGRNRREIEGLIGCFMNFLPLRFKMTNSGTLLDWLREVKIEVIESQQHQDCPFEKIVECARVERRPGSNPLFNVALVFENSPGAPRLGDDLQSRSLDVCVESALLDLRFGVSETEGGMAVTCEYKVNAFQKETVEQLLASLLAVLESLARAPETKMTDLAWHAEKPRAQLQTIAIGGTFTVEPLEEPLRFWLDELEISSQIKFAPFDQVFQQLLDPGSLLASNQGGLNVLLIRLSDWEHRSDSARRTGASNFGQTMKHYADDFIRAVRTATDRGGAPVLVCFCPVSKQAADGVANLRTLGELEANLAAALEGIDGVYTATTAELSNLYPVADYNDPTADDLGHVPYTPLFFTALATLIARKFHALQRPVAKVIALDCDQTLWAGVCGEDGPAGIRLDPPHQALQQFMLEQQRAGKLLVVCSKNDAADVEAAFGQGPAMPLTQSHFSAVRANWKPKSENLKSIAQELNLGLDSFVFIDDSPLECAEVEAHCPEVLTLRLPEDPAQIPQFLRHCWVFDKLKTTGEDRSRASLYRQNQLREESRAQAMSFADFIKDLALEVQITAASLEQIGRVAQLSQRTNQFNVSGRRRTESELRKMESRCETLVVSVKDRFGDYGLVGVMIFEKGEGALVVDSFLLSCRALGRGVEHQMLAQLGAMAAQRGARWLEIPFERLPRNQPALEFLESVGASFQQSGMFRFPADVAAQVGFDPHRTVAPSSAPTKTGATPAGNARPKFVQCRSIALGSQQVAEIHQRIEARSPRQLAMKSGYAAPRTPTERQLCELWQKLLRVDRVGIEDDFFALGGQSLLAVRLFAEVEKMTGRRLPLVTLFQAPTISQLAGLLSQDEASKSATVLVPIQPHGSKPPLYLVHGAGGDVLWGYANLVAHMDRDQPIFALKSRAQIGFEEFESLEDMAAYYVQALREHQPDGPYYLGGYCFGGNVAYEMARQFQQQGCPVALLALLDTAPSNAGYEKAAWWRPEFPALFARNLFYWLRDFGDVKPVDRRRFVERKLRTLGRKLSRWMSGVRAGESVDLEEVIDPALFPEHELKLWEIHLRALAGHVERPYGGHVTLFRTKGHPLLCSFARDLRWGAFASEGVTVKLIPGSHENIFMEPNVKMLARDLTAALSASQERASSNNPLNLLPS